MKVVLFSFFCIFLTGSYAANENAESDENFRTVTKDHCEWKYTCCNAAEDLINCSELCFKSVNCLEPSTEAPEMIAMSARFSIPNIHRPFLAVAPVVCPEGYRPDHRNRCRMVFVF
ncbi:hypothetical protein RP20_CCG027853 [Aedes albopictus]|nr:hypothetical protein RP20_CCG027853 [Aedes albopictus]